MKVFSCPAECEFPDPDYRNYDFKREQQREAAHQKQVKKWLRANGYTGKYTGEIVQYGVADGYAQYMVGDKGRSMILIHLPYGDAYHYHGIEHFPKSEIIKRLDGQKQMAALFAKKS